MITRYLRNQDAVNATLAQQKHNIATLTTPECDRLQKLAVVLEPCRYVSLFDPHTHSLTSLSFFLPLSYIRTHTDVHYNPCKLFFIYSRYVTELLGGESYVSCSVVLPALCHLNQVMMPTDDDPGYMIKFKAIFMKNLDTRKATMNIKWLKMATALDSQFKDLKSIRKDERDEVSVTENTSVFCVCIV